MDKRKEKGKGPFKKKHPKPRDRDGKSIRVGNQMPQDCYATVEWSKSNTITNNGNSNASEIYLATNPQLVDSAQNGTTTAFTVPYFPTWATVYRQYRVESATMTITAVNNENFGVTIVASASNQALSTDTGSFDQYFNQPWARKTEMQRVPNGQITLEKPLRMHRSTANFGGAPLENSVDFYAGNTDFAGTSPSNNWFFFFGIRANNNFTTAGVDFTVRIKFKLRFFELTATTGNPLSLYKSVNEEFSRLNLPYQLVNNAGSCQIQPYNGKGPRKLRQLATPESGASVSIEHQLEEYRVNKAIPSVVSAPLPSSNFIIHQNL